jgi:uncharacterized protein YjbI with pentapeptide repeats
MEARHRSWWQRTRKHLEGAIIGIFLLGLLVLIVLIVLGYIFNWNWTGLGAVNSEPKQHMKTLWDWLQLLIIPAVLAVGGYLFNFTVSRNEQESTRLRDQTEREIAQDNQREAALKEYIDKISELILDKDNPLRKSKIEDEVRKIARVRTLTVLPRLDNRRKRITIQFLHESGLIEKGNRKIDLHDVDLTGADLREIRLTGTDLHGANLRGADLHKAYLTSMRLTNVDLSEADLTDANLWGAELEDTDLTNANLTNAKLTNASVTQIQWEKAKSLKGATMPDGSTHP